MQFASVTREGAKACDHPYAPPLYRQSYGVPNRWRYSPELRNALTISAATKSPLNWLSLFNQKLNPFRLLSGSSFGLRRKYPKYCICTNPRLSSRLWKAAFWVMRNSARPRAPGSEAADALPNSAIAAFRSAASGVTFAWLDRK